MPMLTTASGQLLNSKRFAAFNKLCDTRGRSLNAAGITKTLADGKALFIFEETQILELDADPTIEQLGRGLIRAMHQWVEAWRDSTKAILIASIDLPPGHEWVVQHGPLSDMNLSGSTAIYIRRTERDMYAPNQFGAEFRLFPNELKAHLFLDHGPQYAFKATKLLKDNEPFVYATTIEDMARQLVERYQVGMQRHATMCGSIAA